MLDDQSRQAVLEGCDAVFEEALGFIEDMVAQYAVLNQEQGVLNVVEERLTALELKPQRVGLGDASLHQHPLYAPVPWDNLNKYNLVSQLNPGAEGRSLVFNGHLDVVPAEPVDMWHRPPSLSYREGGWLYGRGAGDMQAGVAAMIYAIHAVQRAGFQIDSPLNIQAVVEEECSGNGALACVHAGYGGDFVLIPEPFGAQILAGQVGVVWLKLRVHGKPVHVLDTAAGINAIEALNPAIAALKALEDRLNTELSTVAPYEQMKHPYNFNVGTIQGGNWTSSVPAYAELSGRLGFPPRMPSNVIMQMIQDAIAPAQALLQREGVGKLSLRFEGFRSEGHLVDLGNPGIDTLAACHRELLQQEPELYYATCTTDLRAFHCYSNTGGTCYGPVAHNIHGVDECVSIESVRHTLRTYALFILSWCAVSKASKSAI